jgi:hypothetical protein
MRFAIYASVKDPNITYEFLTRAAVALELQLTQHFQAYEELGASCTVSAYDGPPVDDHDVHFEITDKIPEAPGAVAYHSVDPINGRAICRISRDACLEIANGDVKEMLRQLTIGISHECLEAEADPNCNEWADMPDGEREVAVEPADPVEGDSYDIPVDGGDPIAVSNFVTEQWFDADAPSGTKFDYMGKLTAPFTMSPGGYWDVRTGGPTGVITQEFGEKASDAMKTRKSISSRHLKRVQKLLAAKMQERMAKKTSAASESA